MVLPVNGTREALFALVQAVVDPTDMPVVITPNPFYQIYEGAALLAGAAPSPLKPFQTSGGMITRLWLSGPRKISISSPRVAATTRAAWDGPTDSDLGIAHPLAHCAVQVELARLMTQKAAALYDAGTDRDAGEFSLAR